MMIKQSCDMYGFYTISLRVFMKRRRTTTPCLNVVPELWERHFIESQVDIGVPPVVADYVHAVVREVAAMTVEERDQFLYEELLEFKLRTTRFHFPDGDILKTGPDEVVLRHGSEGVRRVVNALTEVSVSGRRLSVDGYPTN